MQSITPAAAPSCPVKQWGSISFQQRYQLQFPYVAGAMYRGISSAQMVINLAKMGCLAFFGTGGLGLDTIEENVKLIQSALPSEIFGMNFLHRPNHPERELDLAKLLIRHRVRCIEASAFMQVTPGLVYYKAKGLSLFGSQKIQNTHRIIVKISRIDVLEQLLFPAPQAIIAQLTAEGLITEQEANLLHNVPLIDDVIVESDSGGHTDRGNMAILLPGINRRVQQANQRLDVAFKMHVGAGGGIGTPEAAAAALILGADFIVTGSINQCTPEAAVSEVVKDLLQEITLHDTTYVPASDMFEAGAKVQVVRRGVLFPARANVIYECWKQHDSLEDIPSALRHKIEKKYFQRDFDDIFMDVKKYFNDVSPKEIGKAEQNPKYKMSLVFRWYLFISTQFAIEGHLERKVDFQVQCGPALAAFNAWVKGTALENWRSRHVEVIAKKLLSETEHYLAQVM